MCDVCGGITNDEYLQRLVDSIRMHAWTVQFIEGDDQRNPAFAYTLGLSLRGHPEFITFNCRPESVQGDLGPLVRAVLDGERFDEGDDLSRFPDSTTHLYTANGMFRRAGDPPIQALQFVWPSNMAWMGGNR